MNGGRRKCRSKYLIESRGRKHYTMKPSLFVFAMSVLMLVVSEGVLPSLFILIK